MRLRVEACGICGSDLHFWHGDLPRPIGTAPGHELVGTVVDGPAGLPDVRYAVSPNVTCGTCAFCRSGRSNLCGRAGPGIGLGRNGGLAELVDAPLANLAPIPDGVDPVTASLTEPLAVTVRGVGLGAAERRLEGAGARRGRDRAVRRARCSRPRRRSRHHRALSAPARGRRAGSASPS